jgi:hypothetical protein
MVEGKPMGIHQDKIHLEGRIALPDEASSHPRTSFSYGGTVEDPNALYVKGTLGTYKSSQFGITYWTLRVVDKAGKEYLLATPTTTDNMPTSPKFTIKDGQRVIADYQASFSQQTEPSDSKSYLAEN